jgi:cytochrome c6
MKIKLGIALIAIMASSTVSAFAQNAGADTYKAKCQMCHGVDGEGNTPAGKSMKALPLSSPDIVKKSNDELIAFTKAGKGKMPAYAGKLTDGQIKDVVVYIRTLEKK